MNKISKILFASLATGFAGYIAENALFGPRVSHLTPNLPILPVYVAGGAAIALLEPKIQKFGILSRGVIYGGTLTAIEGIAGALERKEGRKSWDYNGYPIDLPHAMLWSILGLGVGELIRRI